MSAAEPSLKQPTSLWRRRYERKGMLYVLPALVLFAVMVAYPIVRSFYLSFFDYSILEPDAARFVGADNYLKLLTSPQNHRPFWNTLYFAAIFTPPYVLLGLGIALLLNRVRRGSVALRTMIFTPVVVSLAVSAVMWTLFYNGSFGMAHKMLEGACHFLNFLPAYALTCLPPYLVIAALLLFSLTLLGFTFFDKAPLRITVPVSCLLALGVCVNLGTFWLHESFGLLAAFLATLIPKAFVSLELVAAPAEGVLGNARWAMPAIAAMCLWNGVGINVILYLVGLQRISPELYEAAEVDGAGRWQRFLHVTLPQLGPTTYLVVLLSMIGAFKVFGQPFIMTGGGPQDSTLTFVMRLYNLAFRYGKFQLGYASALAYALAVFIFVMSLFVRRLNRPTE
jgi:ABC-type sugar transport system permease subunit